MLAQLMRPVGLSRYAELHSSGIEGRKACGSPSMDKAAGKGSVGKTWW